MRLTIIPETALVNKDYVPYSELDLSNCGIPLDVWALQWYDVSGHIEYIGSDKQNEDITVLPDWAVAAEAVWQAKYDEEHAPPPAPTPAEIQEQNKSTAIGLLNDTDWAAIPSVSDPLQSNPYLTNQNTFLEWRSNVRAVAVNPPSTVVDFPPIPTAVWSS